MRGFGGLCLLAGIVLFFYAGDQRDRYDPVPPDTSVVDSVHYPAGQWELARYGGALIAATGLLFALYPKGR
jgi:hypothetical protein